SSAILSLSLHDALPICKTGFSGVYSANDGMASGAIAALKGAGIDPKSLPITGGDGELAAIQRILAGEQYSTIYLTIKKQARIRRSEEHTSELQSPDHLV